MDRHIVRISKLGYAHLDKVRNFFKNSLNKDATRTIVHAAVVSRIDYCNSSLYSVPKYQIQKLQRLKNSAARLIMLSPRKEHITPYIATTLGSH